MNIVLKAGSQGKLTANAGRISGPAFQLVLKHFHDKTAKRCFMLVMIQGLNKYRSAKADQ